ncbi:MAG: hypothetical protein ABIQ36_07295 [Rhodanobacter sp.]
MTTPLPPIDPPSADESLQGEAELAALYRQLPQNEPSPALDAVVLRAAAAALAESDDSTITERRRAPREPGDWVHPKMATQAIPSIDDARRRPRTPRWLITLGSAASLVLVAGLAWQLRESSPPPSASAAQNAAPSAEVVTATTAKPESAPANVVRSPASPPAAQLADQQADQQAAMQAAAAKKVQQEGELRSAQRQDQAKTMAVVPTAAEPAAPAPSAVASAPPTPPAPVQEVSGNAASGLAGTAGDAAKAVKPAPPAAAPVAVDETASDKDITQHAGDTPAQELDKIQQLFAQGHHDEALQRLRAFHQAHPQWPLPSALQAQLQEP